MFIFGILNLYISNFAYYNLYQRKLKAITRKKYAIHILIRPVDNSLEICEDLIHLHEFPKKNLQAVSKNEWHASSNCFQFPLVKVMVSKIAYIKLENTKNEHFSRQAIEKSSEKIFFQGLRMDHIDQKVDRTDQGYQSHQLLNESDV